MEIDKVTGKKSEPEFVKAMAFVCRAAEAKDNTRFFFNGVLLLSGVEEGTVEVFGTDGRRLHRAVFTDSEIAQFGLTEYVCDRNDTPEFKPVKFVHRTKTQWVFGGFMDGQYPNVFKVIPETEDWNRISFLDSVRQSNDKMAVVGAYYTTFVFHKFIPPRLNSEYLLDLAVDGDYIDEIRISDSSQEYDTITRVTAKHTPVEFRYSGKRDMTAIIMPMAESEHNIAVYRKHYNP